MAHDAETKFPSVVPLFWSDVTIFPGPCVRRLSFPVDQDTVRNLQEATKGGYCFVTSAPNVEELPGGSLCKITKFRPFVGREIVFIQYVALARGHVTQMQEPRSDYAFVEWKQIDDVLPLEAQLDAMLPAVIELRSLFAEFVRILELQSTPRIVVDHTLGEGIAARALRHLQGPTIQNISEMIDDVMNLVSAMPLTNDELISVVHAYLRSILCDESVEGRIVKANELFRLILPKKELEPAFHGAAGIGKGGKNKVEDYRKRFEEIKQYIPKEKWPQIEREIVYAQGDDSNARVSRNYVDCMLSMPWGVYTEDTKDLVRVQQVLDEDHDGLKKVKEQILKFVAIRQLNPSAKGPILCLVGPPGVGKTSIGKSIARSLGRKFARMALGGVRDEAELRGHRRTYVGAILGKIATMIRDSGSFNPLIVLDEVDKVGLHFGHDDVASALLEVLDPEQNSSFDEYYLDIPLDLSHSFFLTTANLAEPIMPALRDRMKIIHLPGYTPQEKVAIAANHLIPKQKKECGIPIDRDGKKVDAVIARETLSDIIQRYTYEAGVRNLEQMIYGIFGEVDVDFLKKPAEYGPDTVITVTSENLSRWCGKPLRHDHPIPKHFPAGVVPALGVTDAGGHVFLFEISLGDQYQERKIKLTGVRAPHDPKESVNKIEESLQIAFGYFSSRTGLLCERIRKLEAEHPLYVQGNLTDDAPKDGPSAGVAAAVALYGALTETPVSVLLAATGAISLSGAVAAVGGIRDKVLAAHRAGIHNVILPKVNESDIEEIPDDVRSEMQIFPVSTILEALEVAFPNDPRIPAFIASCNAERSSS
ncbi:MAG: AAA family ATPase [Candidatus Niyogibacteria bacterium]|nr:AAA family ATPase [Candidatus Niyogibacteria bacterium]